MKRKIPKLMSSWFRGNKAVIKLQMAFAVCLVSQAKAANVYWDANGDVIGSGTAPVGTWGTDEFWNTTVEGDVTMPGAWVDGDTAVFAAGIDAVDAYTVSTTGAINVAGLVFEEGSPTISGSGSLNFGAGAVVMSGGGNGIVAANVSGTGFNKNQGGTVVLSGSTTVTGNLNVNAGTLTIAGPMTVSGNLRFGWNNTGGTQNLIIQTGADITTDRFIRADWY